MRYILELKEDDDLRRHVESAQRSVSVAAADTMPKYGRRIGWYAVARAIKPRVVVETGFINGAFSIPCP